MTRVFSAFVLLLVPALAHADQAGADACAAKLAPDAKAIYDAAAPGFAAASDKRGEVRASTVALVKDGKIGKDAAKENAQAAGACLRELR
jgi:hypothetical protein